LLTGGKDVVARVWAVDEGKQLFPLRRAAVLNAITTVAFSPDGHFALTGSSDGVLLWDLTTRKHVFSLGGQRERVKSVLFSPDGRLAVVAAKELVLWDVDKQQTVRTFARAKGVIECSSISSDGQFVAASITDYSDVSFANSQFVKKGESVPPTIQMWRLGADQPVQQYSSRSIVRSIAFSPGANDLLIGQVDGTALLLRAKTGAEIGSLSRETNTPTAATEAFVGLSPIVIVGTREGIVAKWNLDRGYLENRFAAHKRAINSIAASNSGIVLTGSDDHTACVFDAKADHCLHVLEGHSAPVTSVAIASGDAFAVTGGEDATARIWNLLDGKQVGPPLQTHERVTSVAIAPSNDFLATGEGEPAYGMRFDADNRLVVARYRTFPVHVWDLHTRKITSEHLENEDFITSVAYGAKADTLLSSSEDGTAEIWHPNDKSHRVMLTGHTGAVVSATFSDDKNWVITASKDKSALIWDPQTGAHVSGLYGHQDELTSARFLNGNNFALTTSLDGTVGLWDRANHSLLVSLISNLDGSWAVVGFDGRFDSSSLEVNLPLQWIVEDSRDHALPIEIFMRDYYEPRLLSRLLSCKNAESLDPEACRKQFQDIPPLGQLNRIQPDVKILSVRRGASADEALVEVEALGKKDPTQPNGKTETAAYDLRLFRNGQLVGQWPVPEHGMAGPQARGEWRRVSAVPAPTHTFRVRLASKDRGQSVEFTAYAFNEDRVKSESTPPAPYPVPQDMPIRKPRAYVITIGINGYENAHRNLEFAVKDAQDMALLLRQIKDYEVVSVSLLSEVPKEGAAPLNQATKAKIRAVLGVLAGRSDGEELNGVAGADKLAKAAPDDLVILSFSGHGDAEQNGAFYLLPSDSGKEDAVTPAELKTFISSEELSEWLREVDAGQMAMIIDACHSAASVDTPGFKPGPMGDRGLGQLAYDKGMRILAASQADDVALEIHDLHQGLLTYALVWDGFQSGEGGKLKADLNGDGVVTLEEWLKYGEQRTPSLYEDAKAGKVHMILAKDVKDAKTGQIALKDSTVNPAFIDRTIQHVQTPELFDFHKRVEDVVLSYR
jgi:WD40 repeat protein